MPPEHCRDKGLNARDHAHHRINGVVVHTNEYAREASKGGSDKEGKADHLVGIDPH